MSAKNIVSLDIVKRNIVSKRPTTLSPDYPCDKCGEPAMTNDSGQLRCPSCWLKENRKQIKPIDPGSYRP